MTKALSRDQLDALDACERVIARHNDTSFLEVADALLRIRGERLYRATHTRFDAYLKDRWDLTPSYVSRLIKAREVAADVLPMGNSHSTERTLRPLAAVEPERRAEVFADAVELAREAGREEPTVRDAELAVARARTSEPSQPAAEGMTTHKAFNLAAKAVREAAVAVRECGRIVRNGGEPTKGATKALMGAVAETNDATNELSDLLELREHEGAA